MKYEAVFGDQGLFDGMMPDCEFIVGTYGYKIKNGKCFYCEKYNQKYDWSPTGDAAKALSPVVAMRRIIAEPKRWTVEDQKAGRLPDVGCMVMVTSVDECASVAAINNDAVCVVFHDGEFTTLHKSGISPIETPSEKAQREEDEFVASITKCTSTDEYSSGYIEGLLAAYRKLKGGE